MGDTRAQPTSLRLGRKLGPTDALTVPTQAAGWALQACRAGGSNVWLKPVSSVSFTGASFELHVSYQALLLSALAHRSWGNWPLRVQ